MKDEGGRMNYRAAASTPPFDRFVKTSMPPTHIGFFRAILLGATNALIFAGVLFITEKLVGYVGWPRVWFAWASTSVLLILCFVPTTYLVHRFLASRTNSHVLLW